MKQDVEWEEFTLTQDKGVPLKIDDIDCDEKTYTRALLEAFQEAEYEAMKNGIETNTIVLNPKFSITKKFYLAFGDHILEYAPMVLGKSVLLKDVLPDDVPFALMETKARTAEDDIALFKKYVVSDGKSLRFKRISYKRNKEDFERILKIICNDL